MKNQSQMVFCDWIDDKYYSYTMVVSFPNVRGEMAKLLSYLSIEHKATILFIEYGKDKYASTQHCKIEFEIKDDNKDRVKEFCEQKVKVVEFYMNKDAYK